MYINYCNYLVKYPSKRVAGCPVAGPHIRRKDKVTKKSLILVSQLSKLILCGSHRKYTTSPILDYTFLFLPT
jgi:hypothetical protein